MDTTKQPGISVKKILLYSQSLKQDITLSGTIEYGIETLINHLASDDSLDFAVTFKLVINGKGSESGEISIETEFIGYFNIIDGEENMSEIDFVKYSATALMYPYIREHIASTTLKAGLPVLQLPITNFMAVANEVSDSNK